MQKRLIATVAFLGLSFSSLLSSSPLSLSTPAHAQGNVDLTHFYWQCTYWKGASSNTGSCQYGNRANILQFNCKPHAAANGYDDVTIDPC